MPPREMIIQEETVCKDTSLPDRTRLTSQPDTKNALHPKGVFVLYIVLFSR
jgi:hypothetical protein